MGQNMRVALKIVKSKVKENFIGPLKVPLMMEIGSMISYMVLEFMNGPMDENTLVNGQMV
jgi:hypothetical protein